ncbi:MAG: DUF1674 domain-containing protein [Thermomonas hydrothermalis]|nr:succinate dehydrogenase assembly factor 4 [Thermomonas hydrothermalis]MCL6619799.1 DUF1674 domain-containing protein [Thermomonas hydrothermalis]
MNATIIGQSPAEPEPASAPASNDVQKAPVPPPPPREIGGRQGPDPTRYGDWEKNGRCIDF